MPVLILALPCISIGAMEVRAWRKELTKPRYRLAYACDHVEPSGMSSMSDLLPLSDLPLYPIDMEPLLALPFGKLDSVGVLYNTQTKYEPEAYQPTSIAQYALACWNAYLATGEERHREAFLIQANWLVAHETLLADEMSGWPIPFPAHDYETADSWLSALTQGNCISVLVRAYRLTGEDIFLQVARRALRSFEVDIQDGGVSACVGDSGIFFEEVATYPPAHVLNGYILALFGLYDYVDLTGDAAAASLIERSLKTLHTFIDTYDSGYWSCYDLHRKTLATPFYHALHVTLLKALVGYSSCMHCAALARRWDGYQRRPLCQLRYFVVSRLARYQRGYRGVVSRQLCTGRHKALPLLYTRRDAAHHCIVGAVPCACPCGLHLCLCGLGRYRRIL